MFLITAAALPQVEKKPARIFQVHGITLMHRLLSSPHCIYTSEREYANCNHQVQHFKEVTHEKDFKRDPV